MPKNKILTPSSTQTNKSIAELPEQREKIAVSIQFRNDLLESQKRINYQNEWDRLHGAKRLLALQPNVKARMKEIQTKARQPLQTQSHDMYETKC